MTTVAAFDLDGTITDRDCVVPFLRKVAGTWSIVAGLMAQPVHVGGALARRDRDAVKEAAAHAAFRDRRVETVEPMAVEFAADVHRRWIRPEAAEQIAAHRQAGDAIVIVSASFALYVEPLGSLLGVDGVLATRLATDDGRFTGRLDGPNCRGPEKVQRLHAWLDEHHGGRAAVEVIAYGDSPGDRELLADADVAHRVDETWGGR
ncbi:MAG: HAD-IB family hydrolase [Ilumatobacteraceae bacterium]